MDAVGGVQRGDRVGVRSQRATQRHVVGDEDGDLAAELACGGGHFGADEPTADDRDGLAGLDRPVQVRPQGDGVVDGAQQVHSGQPDARQAAAGRGSRCDDDRVGLDRGVVGQQHRRPARRIRPQGGGVTPRCQVTSRSSASPSSESSTWAWLAPRKSLDSGGRS